MKSVWKYPLFMGLTELELPAGAKVLHVEEQSGIPHIWALVDTEAEKEPRHFLIRGTGHNVDEDLTYVGTWQAPPYVWHLFEIPIQ